MEYRISKIHQHQADIVKTTLNLLPEWFGIPAAVEEYAQDATTLPTYGIYDKEMCVGVLTLAYPSDSSTEIHLIAIHPSYHRKGVGKRLIRFAEEHAKSGKSDFLVVKTLGASHPDSFYQATRRFYLAMGFSPLMELSGVWESNPCLIMAKCLKYETININQNAQ